jgi:hypothetical protein
MKVFVWLRVDKCSESYHSEGGVVVFAEDEEKARAFANAIEGCAIKPEEMPNEVRGVDGGPEVAYIMPDAGCC